MVSKKAINLAVLVLTMVVIISCKDQNSKDVSLIGKWVDVSLTSVEKPIFYEFLEDNSVYYHFFNGEIKKGVWEKTDLILEINGISQPNSVLRLALIENIDGSLSMSNETSLNVRLVKDLKHGISRNQAVFLNEYLLVNHWEVYNSESKKSDGVVEFYRNGKYLFSYEDELELTRALAFDWQKNDIDALSTIMLGSFGNKLVILDNLSESEISSYWYDTDGSRNNLFFRNIPFKNTDELKNLLKGSWRLAELPDNTQDLTYLHFEFEDDYQGYSTGNRLDKPITFGDWNLSKSGKVIVLDQLKNGHEGALAIHVLKENELVVETKGKQLKFVRVNMPP